MAKEFTELQLKEIKERFEKFSNENPDMKINPEVCATYFGRIIAESNSEEGQHYGKNYLLMKQMNADKKVFKAYNHFYKVTLKNSLYYMGTVYLAQQHAIEMNFDSFMKYETFMRDMFVDYIKPNVNLDAELQDYRFGRMDEEQIEDISKVFDKVNRELVYKQYAASKSENVKSFYFDDIKSQMETVSSTDTKLDKLEIAKETAVVYKLAREQYNMRGRLSKIFNPYAWGEAWTLHKVKNYIQEFREPEDKAKISFDDFVTNSAKEPCGSTQEFDVVLEQIKNVIETSNDLSKDEANQDVMNYGAEDLFKELYDEEPGNERNNDFDVNEINTMQNNEPELNQ